MTRDRNKSKEQLIDELITLRQRVDKLEEANKKRRLAQEKLAESEEKYRSLIDHANEGILIADTNGYIIDTNIKIETMLGYSKRELQKKNIVHIHSHNELKRVIATFKETIEKGLAELHSTYILRKDGGLLPVDITGNILNYAGKKVIQGFFRDITERKRIEDALKESEELFRSVFENSHDGIILAIPDGKILAANRAACTIFGYSEKEMRKRSRNDLMDTNDPRLAVLLEERTRTGRFKGELNHVKKGGIKFPAEITSSVFLTKDGQERSVLVIRDITERKHAEEMLKVSEKKYRQLFEALQEGIWAIDENTRTTLVNPHMARMLGYTVKEMAGKHLFDFMDEKGIEIFKANIEKRKKGINERDDFEFLKKDGSRVYATLEVEIMHDDNGKYIGAIAGITDLTERKRVEKELRESEEKYRGIFENSALGIFQTTFEGRFLSINPALTKMLGYKTPEEVIESVEDIAEQIYVNPQKRIDAVKAIQSNKGIIKFENKHRKRDGRIWVGNITMLVINDEFGRPHHLDGFAEDITEKKKIEEKLQKTMRHLRSLSQRLLEVQEAEKRNLARELHDEIGQILTALKINLQAAERSRTVKSMLTPLEESIRIIDELLQQVRNLSVELHPSIIDDLGLVAALRWYMDWLSRKVGFEGRFITPLTKERLSTVLETTCFRVAQEALTNIVRHARAKNVFVELAREGKELLLTVGDDGIGFDIEKARERALKGNSLGLLGMEERVSLTGGHMEITSGRGKGTVLKAYFPFKLKTRKNRRKAMGRSTGL